MRTRALVQPAQSYVQLFVECLSPPVSLDQGNVKSEPPAIWNADRRILQWALPDGIKRGGKQIMQARLAVDEAEVRVAAIPSSAPAMVKCHLVDYTFSSVEIEVSGVAEGGDEAPGKVMKRCRVQCRQQP